MNLSLLAADNTARTAPSRRILLVEDDSEIAAELVIDLTSRGYAVTHVADGLQAAALASTENFDLLVIDRMLPGLDGVALVERLRAEGLNLPVLVLSALGTVNDKVRGLKAGGDDYLTKPVALDELSARVEALLRRPQDSRATLLRAGPLTLDLIDRVALREGREIELLPREFRLLEYLMRRVGQVVTRAMLLEDVWHYRFVPETNLVDVHIGKLRRKIDLPGEPSLIASVRGTGFQFLGQD